MAPSEEYRVRVTKDYLVFCAAHFICFENGQCEYLHGHNYRVGAELMGPLGSAQMVYDFILIKKFLRTIVDSLDHRMLIPVTSREIRFEDRGSSVRLSFAKKEWIFPREDCVLLEMENTTAELLARWIAGQLLQEIARSGLPPPRRIRIDVEETFGQTATYESTGV